MSIFSWARFHLRPSQALSLCLGLLQRRQSHKRLVMIRVVCRAKRVKNELGFARGILCGSSFGVGPHSPRWSIFHLTTRPGQFGADGKWDGFTKRCCSSVACWAPPRVSPRSVGFHLVTRPGQVCPDGEWKKFTQEVLVFGCLVDTDRPTCRPRSIFHLVCPNGKWTRFARRCW